MFLRFRAISSLLLAVLCAAGCKPASTPPRPPPQEKRLDYDARDKSLDGVVTGRVILKGTAPKRRLYDLDRPCTAMHKNDIYEETVIVGKDNGLQNVFVYLRRGDTKKYSFKTPEEPAKIDQIGCVFIPHVRGMMVNQELEIRNSDRISHSIQSVPLKAEGFSFLQAKGAVDVLKTSGKKARTFRKPEVAIRIKCNIHFWMVAYVGVVGNPWFAVTDKDGNFKITGVPPGTYEVVAWHEYYGNPNTKVTPKPKGNRVLKKPDVKVEAAKTVTVDFSFDG